MSQDDGFLRDIWYFAVPGHEIAPGSVQHKVLAGEPVMLGRTAGGEAFAVRDICPHRGVPLSAGRMVETKGEPTVECPYHGWRFGTDGVCRMIPSLVDGQDTDPSRISVTRYPVRELQGNLWIWLPSDLRHPSEPSHEPPVMPGIGDRTAGLVEKMTFHCHVDHAVIGLMDPAHGPFVHQSWWWRNQASIHEKAKNFAPAEFGFSMVAHKPSSNSLAYRILGTDIETEITFRLPGVRVEQIRAGKHTVVGLTTVTPIGPMETEITQSFFWTVPWLSWAKPVARRFIRYFLKQDGDMVDLQQEGLKFEPRLMLINDADVQAKWYFGLKAEWDKARAEARAFKNPVPETVLRWRS